MNLILFVGIVVVILSIIVFLGLDGSWTTAPAIASAPLFELALPRMRRVSESLYRRIARRLTIWLPFLFPPSEPSL